MPAFDYVVWLRNLRFPRDDEDGEFPACLIVLAADAERARRWGDELQRRREMAADEPFISSSIEPHLCGTPVEAGTRHRCALTSKGELPVVAEGVRAGDDFIGW